MKKKEKIIHIVTRREDRVRYVPCALLHDKRFFSQVQVTNIIDYLATMHAALDRRQFRYE